jgi:biotin carboxylase
LTKHLLQLGAGYMGQGYLEAARDLGLSVTLLDAPRHRQRLGGLADEFIGVEAKDDELCRPALRAACAREVDAVVGFGEFDIIGAAFVAAHLGLPGPGEAAARISRDKVLQRLCVNRAGLAQPRFTTLTAGCERLPEEIGYPAVLKSARGSGSSGVELVRDEAELRRALDRREDQFEEFLLEEAVDGQEYSWEALVQAGQVIFENLTFKLTTGPPQFIETGHIVGWELPPPQASEVSEYCRAVVSAIGVQDTIVCLEFRMTSLGPCLMEIAVRAPGDRLMDVLAVAYDADPFAAVIAIALGQSPAGPPMPAPVRSAGAWLPIAPVGRIKAIDGWAAIAQDPATVRADLIVEPGSTHSAVTSSGDRLGCVIVGAPDSGQVLEVLSRFDQMLAVEAVEAD